MASTSARAQMDTAGRIRNAADTLSSDNQSLIADIRKTINCMKEIAVEMEKLHRSQEVQNLEQSVVKLLENYEDTMNFSNVMQSFGSNYKSRPGPELTDFKSMLGLEASRLKSSYSTNRQTSAILRNFREAVWNVHHVGQVMPGEEQEDIVMTSTPFGLSNIVCPITGKCVTELAEPVRSMDCKHIFDKQSIMHYIKKTKKCPVAGCPKPLMANRVVCDPLLPVEIEELRLQNKHTAEPEHIEDFTGLDEED